jgi:hypothetical protein
MVYRFAEYELDSESRELLRNSVPVHLTPKAFQLLELLVRRQPAAVSKAEIQRELWPSTFVTEVNLPALVLELRHALGDQPHRPRYVRTVRGFGYAFCRQPAGTFGAFTSQCVHRLVSGDHEIVLLPGENLLGRCPETASWLRSVRVSPRHARIVVAEGVVHIEDLGTRSGTFLGDRRISGPTLLADGDLIRLGDVTFTFRMDPSPSAR